MRKLAARARLAGGILLGPGALFFPLSAGASAYEVIEVVDPATLRGVVRLKGPLPEDPELAIDRDVSICGSSQKAGMYRIAASGGVRDVLAVVEDIERGGPVPQGSRTVIDNVDCTFVPLVALAYPGGRFVFRNSDPLLHNTHLTLRKDGAERTLYNLALPTQGMTASRRVKRRGFVKVTCDLHPWMRAYVYVSDHPYVAVTDEEGRFEIPGLPAGRYTLWLWHEGLGEQRRGFEVSSGGSTALTIEFESRE